MAGRFASVEEEDEESEEESPISQDYRRPQLDPISEGMYMYLLFLNSMYFMQC